MKKAFDAYENLVTGWDDFVAHVKTNRPTEVRIAQYGYEDIDLADMTIPWAGWKSVVTQPDDSSDIAYERKLVNHFTSMKNLLGEAKNQGVNWLLNTSNFLADVADVSQLCFVLVPAIRGLGSEMQQANVQTAKATARELAAENEKLKRDIEGARINTEAIAKFAGEVEGIKATLTTANTNLAEANTKLEKARADLNKQGLSGAFAAAATNFNFQRLLFGVLFFGALVGLFCIGLKSRASFESIGIDYKFLSGFTLAAPFVWLGWFSARQLGQLARVQQDYEYKKATALAFEAHKKEVVDADTTDKELSKRLLDIVIKNFGDNPVRLLPDAASDHGHPMEEMLSKLSDGKVVDQLIKSLEVWKKP